MASNTSLEILVKLKDEATTGLEKLGNKVGLTGGQFLALGAAVAGVGSFLKTAIDEAAAAEVVSAKLANTIGKTTNDVEGAMRRFDEFNNALQRTTGISGDVIAQGENMLGTFTLTEKQIRQLTPTLLDMAVAMDGGNGKIEDLTGLANSVGKALTLGAGALTRFGVTMTEAQQKAYDLAAGQEKVNMLQEILNNNFGGQAEAAGRTYQGRIRALNEEFGTLKETIGKTLTPALLALTEDSLNSVASLNGQVEGASNLSRVFYGLAKFVSGLGSTLWMLSTVLRVVGNAIGTQLFLATQTAQAGMTAMSAAAEKLYFKMKGVFEGLSGDFDAAKKSFEQSNNVKIFEGAQKQLSGAFKVALNSTKEDLKALSDSASAAGSKFKEAFVQTGLDEYTEATNKAAAAQAKLIGAIAATGGASKTTGKLSEEVKKLTESYIELSTRANDNLTQLRREHEDKMAAASERTKTLAGDLKKLQDEYKRTGEEAQKSFDAQKQTDTGSLADKIVASEQNIADLKKRLSEETDEKQRADLQKQIDAQEAGLSKIGAFTQTITAEITEAKRRASLSEIERAVEDFVKTRKIAQDKFDADREQSRLEFEARQTELQAKLEQQKEQDAKELAIFTEKQTQIQALLDAADARFKSDLEMRHSELTKKVKAEIELFGDLAKAIARAYSGNLSQKEATTITTNASPLIPQKKFAEGGIVTQPTIGLVGEAGAEAIIPLNRAGMGIGGQTTIVNINGGYYLDERAAEKFGNLILGKLKRTARI